MTPVRRLLALLILASSALPSLALAATRLTAVGSMRTAPPRA